MNGDTAGHDPEPISSTASATPSHQATDWQIADYRMIRKSAKAAWASCSRPNSSTRNARSH